MNENFVKGIDAGTHISGTPLTTELAAQASPSLLRNAIDNAVTKVRPMATPLDQISRLGHVRQVDSIEVDYYSADIRKDSTTITSLEYEGEDEDGTSRHTLIVEDPDILMPTETVMITAADGMRYTAYVAKKEKGGMIGLLSKMPADFGEYEPTLLRMGRAATQLDVQTPQYNVLPRKMSNLCQIFKMQVEQSIVMKLSHKEIGWDFTDQQEAAVYDMRLGMEKQYLFGTKMKLWDAEKNETVTLTQGIWNQAGKELVVRKGEITPEELVDLLRGAFTGCSGSRKKVLLAGSGLISALNKLDATKVITASDQETVWGIDFNTLTSKFGKLYVVFSEVFDVAGMPDNGIIIDPEYIQKHVFIPFRADKLDLRGSGQRNTEAVVLTEAACLTLRYPQTHARIVAKS